MTTLIRERLSQDRIVRTALTVMDEVGINAVTVRRLATELGVKPAALYRHVENKSALLDLMDRQMLEDDLRSVDNRGSATWDDWVAARCKAFRRAFLRYRDGALLHATARPGENAQDTVAAQVAAMVDAGFTHETAIMNLFALIQFTVGSALEQQQADPARAPFFEKTFDHGLSSMLTGLQARVALLN
jgi:TetR/AcrR family tetracycline transcriptional repressor